MRLVHHQYVDGCTYFLAYFVCALLVIVIDYIMDCNQALEVAFVLLVVEVKCTLNVLLVVKAASCKCWC